MKLISKSHFLQYLECPKDAWFRLHMPELPEFEISTSEQGIMDQGNEVEGYAKKLKLFAGFAEVATRGGDAQKEIARLMEEQTPAIYQPTFIADGFVIRCDFLVWNAETKKWDLYEVKGTNSLKESGPRDHLSDLTFQTIVLERARVSVGDTYIVHLNKEYIRGEELDVEQLFIVSNCTLQVKAKMDAVAHEMAKAKKYLTEEGEPKEGCECHLSGRSSQCATVERSHPEIPEYSVHDISRIGASKDKLTELVTNGIYHLEEIDDTSDFTVVQQNQIHTHKTGEEIIDVKEIANILDGYSYPLYFFDYETFAPAVPIFPGYGTYHRIPIQFSLHIIDEKGGALRHVDYVHTENSDPSLPVAKILAETIDPNGTVLAWNVGFERTVTAELAERLPEYRKVLTRICDQMQDLRDVFSKQHYVHKDFRGKSGVGPVMEALLPHMTYDHLPYTGSDVGYIWWRDIVNDGTTKEDREKKTHLIREYCKQDTFVMVEIWRILNDLVKK